MISLSQIATNLIDSFGYGGLSLGLYVDSFGVPIPSEILIPLGAVAAIQGKLNPWVVFIIGTVAQILGGLTGYLIGRYGGEPVLDKYGKYILITKKELERTRRAFDKYGHLITMAGRCIPGIRGLVAYPAGIAEMKLSTFLLFTSAGSALWTAVLMMLGYAIGGNLEAIDNIAEQFSIAGIFLVILLIMAYLTWHFRHLISKSSKRG